MGQVTVIRSPREFRAWAEDARKSGASVSFVPTMGALHAGHMALVDAAHQHGSVVAVSIFVNPTQFGPNEDLSRYPRTFDADLARCEAAGVSTIFFPDSKEMYPQGERTRVYVAELQDTLCGASRPGHFEGVATVVTKLFALAGPCTAVFGRKDYQQLKIIERLVRDLLLPVRIVAHPIVRDDDGLALSSRNAYLSPEERTRALAIVASLRQAHALAESGANVPDVVAAVTRTLQRAPLDVDYVSIVEPETLALRSGAAAGGVLAVAAYCGKTRLIDNIALGVKGEPS